MIASGAALDQPLVPTQRCDHRTLGHPPLPSPRPGGCSAISYTRVSALGPKYGFEA